MIKNIREITQKPRRKVEQGKTDSYKIKSLEISLFFSSVGSVCKSSLKKDALLGVSIATPPPLIKIQNFCDTLQKS